MSYRRRYLIDTCTPRRAGGGGVEVTRRGRVSCCGGEPGQASDPECPEGGERGAGRQTCFGMSVGLWNQRRYSAPLEEEVTYQGRVPGYGWELGRVLDRGCLEGSERGP